MTPNNTRKRDHALLWKIHHWAGLYTGIIIGILCFTGALAVFIPEIDLMIQKQYYSVSSSFSSSSAPKIDSSFAQVKREHPKMSGLLINLPDKNGQVAAFTFQVKGKNKAANKSYPDCHDQPVYRLQTGRFYGRHNCKWNPGRIHYLYHWQFPRKKNKG